MGVDIVTHCYDGPSSLVFVALGILWVPATLRSATIAGRRPVPNALALILGAWIYGPLLLAFTASFLEEALWREFGTYLSDG